MHVRGADEQEGEQLGHGSNLACGGGWARGWRRPLIEVRRHGRRYLGICLPTMKKAPFVAGRFGIEQIPDARGSRATGERAVTGRQAVANPGRPWFQCSCWPGYPCVISVRSLMRVRYRIISIKGIP